MSMKRKAPFIALIVLVVSAGVYLFVYKEGGLQLTKPKNPTTSETKQAVGAFEMVGGIAPDNLCFTPDEFDARYCFSNQEEAKSKLNIAAAGTLGQDNCGIINGRAKITYSDFVPGPYDPRIGSVKLVSVDELLTPATCASLN